ncbi:ATP-binding cassette domain-containing protein [Algibacter sp. L4_22]|uniref:ATP-binding cassette domain-containing protein n=1 Tax=Algibacter sp. L4_22 TaxID=2942477 RepID=UPI00201B73D5|nr:ATP-binding cassette domain-containing protein [Algibacter sp. L4_22]MCL5127951.1 ATP-binding cassette domain-containing protein [Algibacter sp. L4_22]
MQKHLAIYISNSFDKESLIKTIFLGELIPSFSSSNGALFSEIVLNKFIDEEIRHGKMNVATETKNSLLHSSEGERKKALLDHIISGKPDYLVIDNVFGNLDVATQSQIEKQLTVLSETTSIVQIANRKLDILPFIKNIYQIKDDILVEFSNTESKTESFHFIEALPSVEYHEPTKILNPLVKFNNVSINYRERAILNSISWEIKSGEFWQLMGPNGSGKSTMLSMIFGDNPKAYGQDITLFGVKKGSGESIWDIKQKIGYFSSEMLRGFTRRDTIGNMIVSGFFDTVGLYKTPTNAQIKIAQHWLRVLNMFDIRKQCFLSLSHGHQRLVLIARAMVKNPPLLILDEPTNGLDDNDAALFCELINKIALETNTAILYVSHRKEANLNPEFVYELVPNENGSIGSILT